MKRRRVVLAFMSLALILVGCHARKTDKNVTTIAPLPPKNATSNQEPSLRGKEYKTVAEIRMVHFDFNKASIRSEDASILKRNYDVIMHHPDWEFLVEGHCDERGPEVYNLALGQRRAAAVRQYYMDLGIDGKRIATISYGKEKPLCTEHNEDCWSQNRRGESKVRVWDEAPKSI